MPQLRLRPFPKRILFPKGILKGILLAVLVLAASGHAAPAQAPRRVVSLNLCTDQMLLALADRSQIASLSPLVRDPSISFLADEAAGLPTNAGKGEAVLFGGADLVLAGPFGQERETALLRRQGLDVLTLAPWRSLDEGRAQIRTVAGRLGHRDRGEALIGAIDAAFARTGGIVPNHRSILTYYRRGWVPASDSLLAALLRHMGFTLQQDRLGLDQGGVARLESIVTAPPDYLLTDQDAGRAVDNGSALLSHPALAAAVPADRRLTVPGRLTICDGPSTPALLDALAAQVRAKVH